MASKLEIKNRIKSVDSTKKITKAMQLVAASKLQKCKNKMEENREYAKYLSETVASILSSIDSKEHKFLKKNDSDATLRIIYTSDMGLCGAYNANIFKLIKSINKPEDKYIILGSRGANWANHNDIDVVYAEENLSEEDYDIISKIALEALTLYTKGEVGSIEVVYTQFVNAVTFKPVIVKLLPVESPEKVESSNVETIFEPAGDMILDDLIPMYFKSVLFSYWLETKTSEQASRQTAMENATDNAEELRDSLELEFNKARQAAITQEITEIVGGAEAL